MNGFVDLGQPVDQTASAGTIQIDAGADIVYNCEVCGRTENKNQGLTFCRTCREYVCAKCFHHHRKEPLKLDNGQKQDVTTLVTCAVPCEMHRDHVICFICRSHNSVICRKCLRPDHKDCRIDYIPDISKEFVEGKEFDDTTKKLDLYIDTCDKLCERVEKQTGEIIEVNTKVLQEIEKLTEQEERNEEYSKWHTQIVEDAATVKRSNTQQITDVFDSCAVLKRELTDFKTRVKHLKRLKEYDETLIEMILAQRKLDYWDARFRKYYNSCRVLHMKFIPCVNPDVKNTFGKLQELPVSNPRDEEIKLKFIKTISVKTDKDENTCMVTALTNLSNDRLLIGDWGNRAMKIVNTMTCSVEDRLLLGSVPWDVVRLPGSKAAVTLPDEELIQFLKTDKALAKTEAVKVDGRCCGIAHGRGKLIVTYREPGKCQIISMKGQVIWTSKLTLGLSNHVHHVAVSKSGDFILVSDFDFDNVKKLDWIGQELSRYEGEGIDWASGIIPLQDGAFFLCSKGNRTIHHLTKDCERIQVFGAEVEQLKNYSAVCFNEDTSILYVSTAAMTDDAADNSLKVLKVTYASKTVTENAD